jgi:transcriptional regulator with XRE-family HTH domain
MDTDLRNEAAPRYFHPIKFRLLRIKAGLGRAELAREARINKDTIKEWEQGKKHWIRPTLATLQKAARALGCEVDDLLEPASWVPEYDDLLLLKAHMTATSQGYHWVGENPNPRIAALTESAENHVDKWLKNAQQAASTPQ